MNKNRLEIGVELVNYLMRYENNVPDCFGIDGRELIEHILARGIIGQLSNIQFDNWYESEEEFAGGKVDVRVSRKMLHEIFNIRMERTNLLKATRYLTLSRSVLGDSVRDDREVTWIYDNSKISGIYARQIGVSSIQRLHELNGQALLETRDNMGDAHVWMGPVRRDTEFAGADMLIYETKNGLIVNDFANGEAKRKPTNLERVLARIVFSTLGDDDISL